MPSAKDTVSIEVMGSKFSSYSDSAPYRLKEKIISDDLMNGFLALDMNLEREVHIFFLKNGLGEKASRKFLLHARKLGNLNHPGILPIYDMGIIDDSCFYTTRAPPTKVLREVVRSGKGRLQRYIRDEKYRLELLMDVCDTVKYAHSMGICVGYLSMDSLIVGDHGEVIISNWLYSKSASREELKKKGFPKEWLAEDLRQIAKLGMQLQYYKHNLNEIPVSQWDEKAGNLSLELQMVLDKAFLQRSGHYASIDELKKDLSDYTKGYPIRIQKGDSIAAMTSFYRRYKSKNNFVLTSCCIAALLVAGLWYLGRYSGENLIRLQEKKANLPPDNKHATLAKVEKSIDDLKEEIARRTEKQRRR